LTTFSVKGAGPAPTLAEMQRVQSELGVRFNDEYRDFISRNNGGEVVGDHIFDIPPDNLSDVDGIIPLGRLAYQHSLFVDQAGPDNIPIMFDSCGNQICMDMSGQNDGAIYFLEHEFPEPEALTFLAPSLSAFLALVRPDDT
jgi:cell wall assembly regulator SMI1